MQRSRLIASAILLAVCSSFANAQCDLSKFGNTPLTKECPPDRCKRPEYGVVEIDQIKHGAWTVFTNWLGGSGHFLAIDLDRRQLIDVTTMFKQARMRLPVVANTPNDFIREYKNGNFERIEIVRISDLNAAALSDIGCAAQDWFERVDPPRETPPAAPAPDRSLAMILVSDSRLRDFNDFQDPQVVNSFEKLLSRYKKPPLK